MFQCEPVVFRIQVDDLARAGIAAGEETIPIKESSNFLRFYRVDAGQHFDPSRTMEGSEMKRRTNFNFLNASLLASVLMLLTMTPGALAQMHGGAPMGGAPNNNINNNNISPDGMQPNGPSTPQSAEQMMERNTFGNLRRNFDVENELSKMAVKNSGNDDVKKFAQQVISENHGLSNELVIPSPNGDVMEPEMVPDQTKKAEKQMKKMTGKPFDQMYLVQMDAYVKNDQKVAQNAESMMSVPKVSEVTNRVQSLSDDREKQIGTLTQETGFKIE
jgi:predicted outer membrane protein